MAVIVFLANRRDEGLENANATASIGSVAPHTPAAAPGSTVDDRTPLPVMSSPARWPTKHGATLGSLASEYPVVLVGTVVGTAPQERPDSAGTGEVYTLATVSVDRWISRAPAGFEKELVVVQHGGVWRGRAVLTYGGDAILRPGDQYLFFLRFPDGAMGYVGVPFGRFPVKGGSLGVVDDQFDELGAVKALRGLGLDEAVAQVRQTLGPNAAPAE